MISTRRALLAGLVATGAGLGVGELVAGAIRGAVSPIVPPGEWVIDHVPAWLKTWAIDTFGTSDKAVLLGGAFGALLVVGVLTGWVAARRSWRRAVVLQCLVAAVGIGAVLRRPAPTFGKCLPALVGSGVAGLVLWWLVAPRSGRIAALPAVDGADDAIGDDSGTAPSSLAPPSPLPRPRPVMALDRRSVLGATAAVAGAAAASGGIGRWLSHRHDVKQERLATSLPAPADPAALPADAELGVAGLATFVTPAARFYTIDTTLVVPQVSQRDWRLRVHGMVDHELTLTYDDLLARPLVERYVALSCVSNEVGGDLISTARWLGVRLADVLAEAGIRPGATQLASRSADGWTCGTPVTAVTDGRDALLAIGMNGEPLPARHGYPVRMVVPGLYGYVSATKWVVDLELTTWEAFSGYWVPRGWAQQAPVKVMSRIDTPTGSRDIAAGRVPIAGLAWAVHRGIGGVEVQIDGGQWRAARLAGVPSDDTWRQWVLDWDAAPGEHVIAVRATTQDGETQTEKYADPAPDGATGHHQIRVTVT